MEEQVNAQRVHHATLLDHLRELLTKLAKSLAESEASAHVQHAQSAAQHGEQRWETGWSLIEVVQDFQILRLVVFEFLDKNLGRPLRSREILAIGLALDEAISASVQVYVRSRDEYLLELEKERVADHEQATLSQKQQTEALKLADQRKNEFLAMLGHELRNPLAPIYQALQIFRLKGISDPDLLWGQEVIRRQTEQITRMVDDLLDVSRITLGKLSLQVETVEMSNILSTALETIRPLVEAKKQNLIVDICPQKLFVRGDRLRLSQVTINLLTNATKYTQAGGSIWLTVERDGSDVLLQVRDNGTGISPELLPLVFDPFTQEERAAERAQGGLGIGLALVRKLVQLHHGSVDARSDGPGKGSEFQVRLPLSKEPAAPITRASSASSGRAPRACRNILIVDDNHDSAHSLSMLLRLSGHKVETAYDGLSGLERASIQVPDVILLDIGLPGMSGLEVARRIRANDQLKHLVLVALTGYGQEEDRQRSHMAGFDAHFVKPVELEELQKLLDNVVES
jgi:signal transduction histidine kinase